MSELAFNMNGDPFEVPAGAVAWRVRKMKPKGAPEVAYGRNGLPLVLPVEADMDDLRAEVNAPGRYRLDPIDAANKPVEGAPAGYVYVHELLAATPDVQPPAGVSRLMPLPAASDNVVIEAMRMNAEIARLVVDKFPQVVEASAILLRAADGAGLPARPGTVLEDDEDDQDEEDTEAEKGGGGIDINALLQLAPMLLDALGGANSKLDVGSIFNWSKAAAKGEASRKAQAEAASAQAAPPEPTIEQQLQKDPVAMQHFIAILAALTPEEQTVARTMAQEMPSQVRTAWFHDLKAMTVEDATKTVRAELERLAKRGGAS